MDAILVGVFWFTMLLCWITCGTVLSMLFCDKDEP